MWVGEYVLSKYDQKFGNFYTGFLWSFPLIWATTKKTSNLFSQPCFLTDFNFLTHFQLDAVPKKEASVQRRMELQREVDALKVSFEKQVGTTRVGGHSIVHDWEM